MESNTNDKTRLGRGLTWEQIERLRQFRSAYAERERQQQVMERRRLQFVRWLVVTGRLTENLANEN